MIKEIRGFQVDYENPFWRFKGGAKPLPPPPPAAIPEVGQETPEAAIRKVRRRKGFKSALTMGGELAPMNTGKKIQLG
jgi:hypothetical protein